MHQRYYRLLILLNSYLLGLFFFSGHAFASDFTCFENVYRRPNYEHRLLHNQNSQNAVELCKREFAQNPEDITTIGALGAAYYYDNKFDLAIAKLEKAYSLGDWYAALVLAEMYYLGIGVPEDMNKFFRYVSASKQYKETSWSLFYLGKAYENGWGIIPDEKKARAYFWRAAEKNSGARVYLANQIFNDEDATKEDLSKINKLLIKEIENGNPRAQTEQAIRIATKTDSYVDFVFAKDNF